MVTDLFFLFFFFFSSFFQHTCVPAISNIKNKNKKNKNKKTKTKNKKQKRLGHIVQPCPSHIRYRVRHRHSKQFALSTLF